ncbi:YaiI/YqxD family protein [Tuberibacillus sp. Marseille-P3662]|uniref:YaiI/YqxD family protein n=1 Tax=Tuberibacillus sp. Marseille-P3662 TaxID=1965358 RepID=UPI000A1C9E01|nr:DUF188 domain-containing protein [Tuberibacillus sp. Marseille-P3662]
MDKRQIYVDADSCPVKHDIIDLAEANEVQVLFVASYNHMSHNHVREQWIFVDPVREAADIYIVNHVGVGDIVVTQDMGLASLLTKKNVYVLTPKGKYLKEEDMSNILFFRHMTKKDINAGRKVKGPSAFTDADRERFRQTLSNILGTWH